MSIRLEDVDKNFKVESTLGIEDLKYYDAKNKPFTIYGADPSSFEGEGFWRMPERIYKEVNRLFWGCKCSAGFRVRFKTDSEYVAIKVKFHYEPSCMSDARQSCDLYIDHEDGSSTCYGRFVPGNEISQVYEGVKHFGSRKERYFTLNLMTYDMLESIHIGLQEDATVGEGKKYLDIKPILYYGSSITQGGCASRPGNTYEAIINRRNNVDYINLGFSGGAKAELPVMEYIASRDMSIFVYDYDYNAPDAEYLKETHERGYKIVREKHPDLPIILVSVPYFGFDEDNLSDRYNDTRLRRTVVMETYINAVKDGDQNIYFIDGAQFFCGPDSDACLVDGCHPTDIGFMKMADVIGSQIDAILRRMK